MTAEQMLRLIGREGEQQALRADLDAVLAGAGRFVYLAGEAGVGKTRLASALAQTAAAQGVVTLWGHCDTRDGAPFHWPVSQALLGYCATHRGSAASEIARILESLRALEVPDAADLPTGHERLAQFARVAAGLAAAARETPILVVFDDLHAATAGSLHLIEHLARELVTSPILFVATLRDQAPANETDQRALSALLRHGRRLRVEAFGSDGVRELLHDCLQRAPEPALVERVLDLTQGNPFFVIELAHLLATPMDAQHPLDLPRGVRELMADRLAPLAPSSLRALEAAAVLGREFDLAELAPVCNARPEEVLAALAAPLELRLVEESAQTVQGYAFRHALLREAIYAGLTPTARGELHRAAGEALEAAGAADDDRLPALAHHFVRAARVAGGAKAARYGCAAGERALRLFAFEEAASHFTQALHAAGDAGVEWRMRAQLGLAEAAHVLGEADRATEAFEEGLALARGIGPEALARAVLRFSRRRTEISLIDTEMCGLLEEALAASEQLPTTLRAVLTAQLAAALHLDPHSRARSRALSDGAVGLARRAGDSEALAMVLARRMVCMLGPDDLEERVALADELLSASGRWRAIELEALLVRIDAFAERGDRAGLDAALASFEQRAEATRLPFFRWSAASLRAAIALMEARFADAEREAQHALELGRAVQPRTATMRFAQQLFTLRGWQGKFAEVEPLVRRSAEQARTVPAWRCALAQLYSAAGRVDEARLELDALATSDFAEIPRDTNWLTSLALLASVCARLGDSSRAATLFAQLRPYSGRIAVSRFAVMRGPVDLALGQLAGACGELAVARTHLAAARTQAASMRSPLWRAEIAFAEAEVLRHCGRERDRELALRDEAEAIARATSLPLMLDWLEQSRSDASAPSAGTQHRRAGDFLREGSVWTLALDGRVTRLPDLVGLRHVARLLATPAGELHVLDLAKDGPSQVEVDAGELLDSRARAAYSARARAARDDLAQAEANSDIARAAALREELDLLASELSRGIGLGGRSRRAASASERARVSVTRAIRYAIDRIAEHDAELGEHLRRSIRTGAFCSYSPSSRETVAWRL